MLNLFMKRNTKKMTREEFIQKVVDTGCGCFQRKTGERCSLTLHCYPYECRACITNAVRDIKFKDDLENHKKVSWLKNEFRLLMQMNIKKYLVNYSQFILEFLGFEFISLQVWYKLGYNSHSRLGLLGNLLFIVGPVLSTHIFDILKEKYK